MKRRPLLILNGKPTRYNYLYVCLTEVLALYIDVDSGFVDVDGAEYRNVEISQARRPSGRHIICVHTEVNDA